MTTMYSRPTSQKVIKALLSQADDNIHCQPLLFFVRGNQFGATYSPSEVRESLNSLVFTYIPRQSGASYMVKALPIKHAINDFERTYKVLSLGAGVQSSVLLLMADRGLLGDKPDVAVFADTRDEPDEVYEWLKFLLQEVKTIPIHIESKGSLISDYLDSFKTLSDGSLPSRASSIPFFAHDGSKREGKLIRQCTVDYKIDVVWKAVRNMLGYTFKQSFRDQVEMWIGISTDEIMRAKPSRVEYIQNKHPLLDIDMSRADCLKWLSDKDYGQAPKSSCLYCPYHSDRAWQEMKDNKPEDFESACLIDEAIRNNPRLKSKQYIHRSCKPLREVEFKPKEGEFDDTDYFNNECLGMCGV